MSYRFGSTLKAYELIGYQSPYRKTALHRPHVRKVRAEMMQQLVEMFHGEVAIFSWAWKRSNCLNLRNRLKVAARVCRSIHLARKGRMWVLQAAKDEPCRATLMAGMNPENSALEAFYVTGRLRNRCKLHITEENEWLKQGVRLHDLRSFYEAVMGRKWK